MRRFNNVNLADLLHPDEAVSEKNRNVNVCFSLLEILVGSMVTLKRNRSSDNSEPNKCERVSSTRNDKRCTPVLVCFRLLHSIRYLSEMPRESVSIKEGNEFARITDPGSMINA